MATHFSILAWRIPWTEEPGGIQSMGLHRVRHDWSDLACTHDLLIPRENICTPPNISCISCLALLSHLFHSMVGPRSKNHAKVWRQKIKTEGMLSIEDRVLKKLRSQGTWSEPWLRCESLDFSLSLRVNLRTALESPASSEQHNPQNAEMSSAQ